MKTLGIDLASQALGTAAAEIDWPEEGPPSLTPFAEVEAERLTDRRLAELISSPDYGRVAIDVPFGWPREMVSLLGRWSAGEPVELREERPGSGEGVRSDVLYRLTDRKVQEATRVKPIAVGVNTLAWVALRALHVLSAAGIHQDRAGFRSHVIETYPKGALTRWRGMPKESTKAVEGSGAVRAQVVDRVVDELGLVIESEDRLGLIEDKNDHRFDALLCALVARAVMLGQTGLPEPAQRAIAEQEGWIHLPGEDSSFDELATPRFQTVAMPERFALETLEPNGEWLPWGEYEAGLFERLPDGAYVCAASGGSPTWIRCVRQENGQLHVIDGRGRPFIYRLTPLPAVPPGG